jgi:hypothetical protein
MDEEWKIIAVFIAFLIWLVFFTTFPRMVLITLGSLIMLPLGIVWGVLYEIPKSLLIVLINSLPYIVVLFLVYLFFFYI